MAYRDKEVSEGPPDHEIKEPIVCLVRLPLGVAEGAGHYLVQFPDYQSQVHDRSFP